MTDFADRELRRDLILVAAYLFRTTKPESPYVHCHRVLRHAMTVAGLWDAEMEREKGRMFDGQEAEEFPLFTTWYSTLIDMATETPESARLLNAFGNVETPAGAAFVAIDVTPSGRELAEVLLRQHPTWDIPLRW